MVAAVFSLTCVPSSCDMSRILKVNPPSPLPASGVTAVSFRSWHSLLMAYLEQDKDVTLFTRGGPYASWLPRHESDLRIRALAIDDPALVALQLRLDADTSGSLDEAAAKADLLNLRNSELSKFLTLIACLLPPALTWNVQSLSNSFEWVFKYLTEFYGIRKQGARFMKIDEITYNGTDSPQQFYVEIHQAFADSLRKSGERVLFWDNRRLDRDEVMYPTLENTVVLWWLRALDPRLPKRVSEVFGHFMKDNVSLRDIQPEIADRVPDLLQELDELEASRASVRALRPLQPELSAIQPR